MWSNTNKQTNKRHTCKCLRKQAETEIGMKQAYISPKQQTNKQMNKQTNEQQRDLRPLLIYRLTGIRICKKKKTKHQQQQQKIQQQTNKQTKNHKKPPPPTTTKTTSPPTPPPPPTCGHSCTCFSLLNSLCSRALRLITDFEISHICNSLIKQQSSLRFPRSVLQLLEKSKGFSCLWDYSSCVRCHVGLEFLFVVIVLYSMFQTAPTLVLCR